MCAQLNIRYTLCVRFISVQCVFRFEGRVCPLSQTRASDDLPVRKIMVGYAALLAQDPVEVGGATLHALRLGKRMPANPESQPDRSQTSLLSGDLVESSPRFSGSPCSTQTSDSLHLLAKRGRSESSNQLLAD